MGEEYEKLIADAEVKKIVKGWDDGENCNQRVPELCLAVLEARIVIEKLMESSRRDRKIFAKLMKALEIAIIDASCGIKPTDMLASVETYIERAEHEMKTEEKP